MLMSSSLRNKVQSVNQSISPVTLHTTEAVQTIGVSNRATVPGCQSPEQLQPIRRPQIIVPRKKLEDWHS